jgi:hypothetical protein
MRGASFLPVAIDGTIKTIVSKNAAFYERISLIAILQMTGARRARPYSDVLLCNRADIYRRLRMKLGDEFLDLGLGSQHRCLFDVSEAQN